MLYKLVLKPLSWIYGLILKVRHIGYDRGFFYSKSFEQPIIKIGNLSLGGTGKSPFASYLAGHFEDVIACYILSRGYGRRTRGVLEVMKDSISEDVGDEPLMLKRQLSKTRVFVSEDRIHGIEAINQVDVKKKLVLLDDAIQHRRLSGGYQILLTDYSNPFFSDELLPLGRLRDLKSRALSIDLIVVSKCEENHRSCYLEAIGKWSKAKVLFASIEYQPCRNYFTNEVAKLNAEVVSVSALANSTPFVAEVSRTTKLRKHYEYKDHTAFSKTDVLDWMRYCKETNISQMVVTEKDAVRLDLYRPCFEEAKIQLLILPMKIKFSEEDNTTLFNGLNDYINQFK